MPDSRELLARSIEREVRGELPAPVSAGQLSEAIGGVMREEARTAELRIARLRVLVVAPLVVLRITTLAVHDASDPLAPTSLAVAFTALLAATWLGLAGALAVALRRGWYAHWLPHAAPVVDGAVVLTSFLVPLFSVGADGRGARPAALALLTALCAFLVVTGGMRLSRSSTRISTGLAIAIFAVAAIIGRVPLLPVVAVTAVLGAIGVLASWVTGLMRRLVIEEVARTTLYGMNKEAMAAIDAHEQVLKIVLHDLRSPLNTIGMGASLLMDVQVPPELQREHLQRIRRAGQRMDRLVRDLLDVAKFEAGRLAIEPRPVDLAPLITEACEMLEPLAAEKQITLRREVAEGLPRVPADAGRVLQALTNLVGNAIKFTPDGGRITVRATPNDGAVHVAVSDTGCGIPASELGRIFKRFWQANPADRRGIGLGLTIAKGIMDAHGAPLWAESRVGEGTTFHFVLGSVIRPFRASGSWDRRSHAGTPAS